MNEEMNHKTQSHESLIQVVKFVLFSISAGIVQILIFELVDNVVGLTYWPSYLIALLFSVLWNFTLNRKFTFQSANHVPTAMLKVLGFYCVFTPLSTLWGSYFANIHVNHELILAGTMAVNLTTEFLYDKYIVFRKKTVPDTTKELEVEEVN